MVSSITPRHITEKNVASFVQEKIQEIIKITKGNITIAATSGGVDSTIATILAGKALGDKLKIIFINTGMMRKSESEVVKEILAQNNLHVNIINAADLFFDALKGKTDPEEKRKAFRRTFYDILSKAAKDSDAKFLVQGTIYPDIIESTRIKTQHNVLSQIGIDPTKEFGLHVIEPLKQLYKNQVRIVGRFLKVHEDLIQRQPFPGPGLSVRIIGEVTRDKVKVLQTVTSIVEEELKSYKPSQYFAVLLKGKMTGVKGDERLLGYAIAIRAVKTDDFMTARVVEPTWETLKGISNRITREVPQVVKVLYDITTKPPSTIEYE